ncbi:hypothetical protein GGR58DRAFT_98146 [Xylaria digitata]|nr:hypothetical protein GGR58DRAFT_98146 [Xylaria digitata]
MIRRIILRLRHLLPCPLSFRLMSHLPILVQSLLFRSYTRISKNPRKPSRLHTTSYLDGLRGLAALIVCVCHYTEENHPNLTTWYGVFPNPALALEPSWIQLPFVRVIFSGRPMVHLFFVISGFALSVKALAAIRERKFEKCHSILASAAFRRPIRLCGPPVVSMVFIVLFIRAGWLRGALPTSRQQLNDWVAAVYYHVIWPWSWDTHLYPGYNVNLWTIPVELCHSMLLFLMVLAMSRIRAAARITIVLSLVVYCLHCGKWAAAEFIAGILLAEAHLVGEERRGHERLPLSNSPPCFEHSQEEKPKTWGTGARNLTIRRLEIILHIAILTAALFIAGWPNVDSSRTPGIRLLVFRAPKAFNPHDPQGPQKFWFAIAAMGSVWSCGRISFVHKILETRFAQYAGRISFAVYIVHGPVFNLFSDAVLGVSRRPERWVNGKGSGLRGWIGIDTAFNRTLCWATGFAILFPAVLVTAHFFCRFVDEPLVRFAKTMESWAVSDADPVLERETNS